MLLLIPGVFSLAVNYGCFPDDLVVSMTITSPINNFIVTTNNFYIKTVASVTDIGVFQSTNADYSFCIDSYLLHNPEHDRDNHTNIYHSCGLDVFDEHYVPGYKEGFPGMSQIHVVEASLMHRTKGLLCMSGIVVECFPTTQTLNDNDQQTTNNDLSKSLIMENIEILKKKIESFFEISKSLQQMTHNQHHHNNNHKHISCSRPVIHVAIGIKSSALHIHLRQAIRETWFVTIHTNNVECMSSEFCTKFSGSCVYFTPYFIIGRSEYNTTHVNSTVQSEIDAYLSHEQLLFGDILLRDQIDVIDSYHTLTQKTLQFIHYVVHNITHTTHRGVDYVVMCDDDVYVDITELTSHLTTQHRNQPHRYYAGEVFCV